MNEHESNFDYEEENQDQFDIYAELSQSQYRSLISGEKEIIIPKGVTMSNMRGQRTLFFKCANKDLYDMTTEALDADRINWQ